MVHAKEKMLSEVKFSKVRFILLYKYGVNFTASMIIVFNQLSGSTPSLTSIIVWC
jgi:hypothetical protein